jgi:hypothetical protein
LATFTALQPTAARPEQRQMRRLATPLIDLASVVAATNRDLEAAVGRASARICITAWWCTSLSAPHAGDVPVL